MCNVLSKFEMKYKNTANSMCYVKKNNLLKYTPQRK